MNRLRLLAFVVLAAAVAAPVALAKGRITLKVVREVRVTS
jgi:hypothetical protein